MSAKALVAPLSPPQQRTAALLVRGLSIPETAAALGLSPSTVAGHAGSLRIKVGLSARCALHILVNALIVSELAAPPAPDRAAPSLLRKQLRLLRAAAQYTRITDIARAAKTRPTDVAGGIEDLLTAAGATDLTHLVILAHGWGLLAPRQRMLSAGAA